MRVEFVLANSTDLTFLELEPFSKREALNWLATKANDTVDKKIHLSIRHTASIWNWRKSKVEWFLKILKKKSIIEISADQEKISITPCNLRLSKEGTYDAETAHKTAILRKPHSNELKMLKQDNHRTVINSSQTQQTPCFQDTQLMPEQYNHRTQILSELKMPQKMPEQDNHKTPTSTSDLDQAPCFQEAQLTLQQDNRRTKIHSELKIPEPDTSKTLIDPCEHEQAPRFQEIGPINAETVSRQNLDCLEKKEKEKKKKERKERKEPKERKERTKEKKEKEKTLKWEPHSLDILSLINQSEISSFAESLAMDSNVVEWELAKFTDHLKSSGKKPPHDIPAAFRNWLRRSLEFNKPRGENEQRTRQINKTKPPTSFELFLAGAAHALAERQRHRLAR